MENAEMYDELNMLISYWEKLIHFDRFGNSNNKEVAFRCNFGATIAWVYLQILFLFFFFYFFALSFLPTDVAVLRVWGFSI